MKKVDKVEAARIKNLKSLSRDIGMIMWGKPIDKYNVRRVCLYILDRKKCGNAEISIKSHKELADFISQSLCCPMSGTGM